MSEHSYHGATSRSFRHFCVKTFLTSVVERSVAMFTTVYEKHTLMTTYNQRRMLPLRRHTSTEPNGVQTCTSLHGLLVHG